MYRTFFIEEVHKSNRKVHYQPQQDRDSRFRSFVKVLTHKGGETMPPHCDTLDGPVVKEAMRALEKENVDIILPYVPKEGEEEVRKAFEKVVQVRKGGDVAREVADLYFFETVVRVHRAGEGAPFTGLKPAGLDVGPVIPVAEKAIASGSPDGLVDLLTDMVNIEVRHRFEHMMHLKAHAEKGVDDARDYVKAMLGLQVWAHSLYKNIKAEPHAGHHEH